MNADEDGGRRGQDGDVKPKETRQRRASHVVASAQESEDGSAYDGNHSGDFGPHLSRKKRQLVPRKEIPTESKTDHDKEQDNPAQPRNFARRVIRAQKKDAEHVNEQRRDHEIG